MKNLHKSIKYLWLEFYAVRAASGNCHFHNKLTIKNTGQLTPHEFILIFRKSNSPNLPMKNSFFPFFQRQIYHIFIINESNFFHFDATWKISAVHILLLIYFHGPFILVMIHLSKIGDIKFSILVEWWGISRKKIRSWCGDKEENHG